MEAAPGQHQSGGTAPDSTIDPDLGPEHYLIGISRDAVAMRGGSPAALAHARSTLSQIMTQCGDSLPCLQIEDWPDFPRRGYMLDVSRNRVPTMEALFKLVDLLAHLKYNELQLYTEHTFAYSGHALVWGDASPMTGDEYDRLNAYCGERHIDLVPNQNSFGHMGKWLKYPEYNYLAECPQGYRIDSGRTSPHGTSLKPDEDSLAFLSGLYNEFLPHFSSRFFNVGCDETWELGMGWSKPLVDVEGREEVYLRFLRRIHTLVESHGRHMQFWADIIIGRPDLVALLPDSVWPMIWGYDASHPFDEQCRTVAECDRPFYVVPGDSTWNSFSGRHANMVENLRSAARHGLRNGATGFLLTSWGDNGHHKTWPTALPALYLGATLSWYGDGYHDYDVAKAMDADCFKDDSGKLAAALIAFAALEDGVSHAWRNSNLSFGAFFAPPGAPTRSPEVAAEALQDMRSRLADIRESVRLSRPKCADAGWIKDELELAMDMFDLGLRKLLADGNNVSSLRSDGQSVVGRFEKLWLNRSRPGGLYDSSRRIREAMFGQNNTAL